MEETKNRSPPAQPKHTWRYDPRTDMMYTEMVEYGVQVFIPFWLFFPSCGQTGHTFL